MDATEKSLLDIFEEAMEQKNISYEKLALLTNIPERYIVSLQNLDLKHLPALPYVRGYLQKICEVLGLNFEQIWKQYKTELSHKTSGAFDKLPINRFAIQKINRKNVFYGIVAAIILVFAALNFNNFFGKPLLEISNPKETLTTSTEAVINLSGKVNPGDKLVINEREVISDSFGNFESEYELQPGLNTIDFKAKKLMGKENSQIRQVIFEATSTPQYY